MWRSEIVTDSPSPGSGGSPGTAGGLPACPVHHVSLLPFFNEKDAASGRRQPAMITFEKAGKRFQRKTFFRTITMETVSAERRNDFVAVCRSSTRNAHAFHASEAGTPERFTSMKPEEKRPTR